MTDPPDLDEIRKQFRHSGIGIISVLCDEIERLADEVERLRDQDTVAKALAGPLIQDQREEIARLRKALKFYGAAVNYEREMGMRPASPIQLDKGKIARAALGSK